MRSVGEGGDEAHRQGSGHQKLLQQQRCKKVQRIGRRVSTGAPLTSTSRAVPWLLLASHSTSCVLIRVSIACLAHLCSLCWFALSAPEDAENGKIRSRLLPRLEENRRGTAEDQCNCSAEQVDSAGSSAMESD